MCYNIVLLLIILYYIMNIFQVKSPKNIDKLKDIDYFDRGNNEPKIFMGLLYLLNTYNNVSLPLNKNDSIWSWTINIQSSIHYALNYPQYPYNMETGKISVNKSISFPLGDNFKYFIDSIKNSNKRFLVTYLTLAASQIGKYSNSPNHYNGIIIDNKLKTIERFDSYGKNKFNPPKYSKIPTTYKKGCEFDIIFKKIMKDNKILKDYSYICPDDFPFVYGFQSIEEKNISEKDLKYISIAGNCSVWVIWYLNMRLSYPDTNPIKLQQIALKILKNSNISFGKFMRNYSIYIKSKTDELLYNLLKNKFTKNEIKSFIELEEENTKQDKINNKIIKYLVKKCL